MENTITIQTVKEQIDLETNELIGYLVDGNKSVPLANGNRYYKEVLEWIELGNTPEPAYTDEELAKIELDKKQSEARQYLNDTDWYVTRQSETGIEVPAEVLTKRQECRELL